MSIPDILIHTPKPQLKILVVGKHGIGKRTLIAELFGEGGRGCSTDYAASCQEFTIRSITIQILTSDSPNMDSGLMEGLDLVVFALRMDDTRYRGDDQELLQALSRVSGRTVWSRGVVVLTFANRVTYVNQDTGKEQQDLEHLKKKAREWVNRTQTTLREERIPQAVLSALPTVPVGHPSKLKLYDDMESWKTSLIKCMIIRLQESGMGASAAMWQAMEDQIDKLASDELTIKCEW